jgi:phage terminase large subunit
MRQSDYAHVWEGQCRPAVEGAIYYDQIADAEAKGRVRDVPYDPLLKVHAIWDLGWNDSMAVILAQRSSSEIRVIDYVEDSHRVLSDYVQELKARPLNWGNDYLPHDGFTKDYKTGKSAEEILKAMGRTVVKTPNLHIENGIKAAREVFVRCYFAKDKTERLVECLKRYRRSISQATNEPGNPLHDEYSHGADAFRYMALVADQMTNDNAMFTAKIKYPRMGVV